MSSNENISYTCCKTKSFIHYVCVKCSNVIHKCCVSKYRNKIRFVKDNKIVCCKLDEISLSEENEEKSILEKTISELNEDSAAKNRHIKKLKDESKLLLEEAIKSEAEMSALINKQEKIIQELNLQIRELKKQIQSPKKITRNNSTQTSQKVKHISTSTDLLTEDINMNIINKPFIQNKQRIQETAETKEKNSLNNILNLQKYYDTKNKTKTQERKKKQILLLTDDIGRNIERQLTRQLGNSHEHEIVSIIKPGALLHQVIHCVENLTKNFTLQDYVVIIAGSNDINIHKTPSFRLICNKLKQCSHTNVLFTSVPYLVKNHLNNRHIFKYNTKLNNFLSKFNTLVPGVTSYVEINKNSKKYNKALVALSIKEAIFDKKAVVKNLTFVNICDEISLPNLAINSCTTMHEEVLDVSLEIVQESSEKLQTSCDPDAFQEPYDLDNGGEHSARIFTLDDSVVAMEMKTNKEVHNKENFLYPRISQISFAT